MHAMTHRIVTSSPVSPARCFAAAQAFLAVFQILIADDWPVHLADAFRGTDGNYGVFAFSVTIVVLGMYVVLTLFVAILLERFAGQDDDRFDKDAQTAEVRTVADIF